MSNIKKNLEEIRSTLNENITLIAVSKTKSAAEIMEAYEAGVRDFGENKVQELEEKYELLPKDIRWHLIGGLQTNKVRKVLGKTHLIQSLDRESLALEINKRAEKMNIVVDTLIEVNIGEEPQKDGVLLKDLDGFIRLLKDLEHIRVKGLMAIIPQGNEEENRQYFRRMYALYQELSLIKQERFTMDVLSMGMSTDYLTAVDEGSTMVRVGTGIFGARNKTI